MAGVLTWKSNPVLSLFQIAGAVVNELRQFIDTVFKAGDLSYELSKEGVRVTSFVLGENKLHISVDKNMMTPEKPISMNPMFYVREMLSTGQAHLSGIDNKADYVNNSFGIDFEFEYPDAAPEPSAVESRLINFGFTGMYSTISDYFSISNGNHEETVWFDIALN